MRHTFDSATKYIQSFGYTLLSKEFKSSNHHIHVKCNNIDNPHEYDVIYGNFLAGYRCSKCSKLESSKKQRLSYDFVKNKIESLGYQLLSKEYINNRTPLNLIDTFGNNISMSFGQLTNNIERKERYNTDPQFKMNQKKRNQINYSKNRVKIIKYNTEYNKQELPRLRLNLRTRINIFLKNNGLHKNKKLKDVLGCSYDKLIQHLEHGFYNRSDGTFMTLMNPDVHIDHIFPLCIATNEREMERLCHFTNLRPLWKEDNAAKSSFDKYLKEHCNFYL